MHRVHSISLLHLVVHLYVLYSTRGKELSNSATGELAVSRGYALVLLSSNVSP